MVGENVGVGANAALVAEQQFARLGFDVRLRRVALGTMFGKFCGVPSAEVAICPNVGWLKDFADAQTFLAPTFDGDRILEAGNNNWSQLDDPGVNERMDRASLLTEPAERARAWARDRRGDHGARPGDPLPVAQAGQPALGERHGQDRRGHRGLVAPAHAPQIGSVASCPRSPGIFLGLLGVDPARALLVVARDRVADLLRDLLEARVRVSLGGRPGCSQRAQTDKLGQGIDREEIAAAARTQIGRRTGATRERGNAGTWYGPLRRRSVGFHWRTAFHASARHPGSGGAHALHPP